MFTLSEVKLKWLKLVCRFHEILRSILNLSYPRVLLSYRRRGNNNPCLPMDIVASEILPRLPSRSLVQYKCVSKFFRDLISSSEFMKLHLRLHPLSSSTTNRILLFVTRKDGKDDGYQCLYTLALNGPSRTPRAINFPVPEALCAERNNYNQNENNNDLRPWSDNEHCIYSVGSCNGLVCLGFPWSEGRKRWGVRFMFLNPLTRNYSYDTSFTRDGCRYTNNLIMNSGFGYDDKSDDYKLVVVTETHHYPEGTINNVTREVNVYSMKTNSWKCVEVATKQISRQMSSISGAVIDNHLIHWLFLALTSPNYYTELSLQIACFDLEKERWSSDDVPLPKYRKGRHETLGVLDGCLCLVIHGNKYNEVWIMKEYGVQKSWMKLFRTHNNYVPNQTYIYPFYRRKPKMKQILLNVNLPLQLQGQGEGEGEGGDGEFCFWYNFNKKTSKKLKFHFQGPPPSIKALTVCLESLNPVFGGSQMKTTNNESRWNGGGIFWWRK